MRVRLEDAEVAIKTIKGLFQSGSLTFVGVRWCNYRYMPSWIKQLKG